MFYLNLKSGTCTFAECITLRRISEGNSCGAGVQAKTIIYASSRDGGGGGCLYCSVEVYPHSLLGLNNGEFPVMEILESAAVALPT